MKCIENVSCIIQLTFFLELIFYFNFVTLQLSLPGAKTCRQQDSDGDTRGIQPS